MRSGSPTLIRHPAELNRPFSFFLPATFPTTQTNVDTFDVGHRYTWMLSAPWVLLAVNGNRWTDPGRLWEPNVGGGAGASDGHVLSQEGNQANDQNLVTGDKYFIYVKTTSTSCKTLLDANSSLANGVYTISPDGSTPVSTYCDMTGGGWTLVENQVAGAALPDSQADVNAPAFGDQTQSFRMGLATIKLMMPQVAWKLTDTADVMYFRPTCQVDWSIAYNGRAVSDCTIAYTSTVFNTPINGGFVNVSTRGIGINGVCTLRAYNSEAFGSTPNGPALSCTGSTSDKIQLWYR